MTSYNPFIDTEYKTAYWWYETKRWKHSYPCTEKFMASLVEEFFPDVSVEWTGETPSTFSYTPNRGLPGILQVPAPDQYHSEFSEEEGEAYLTEGAALLGIMHEYYHFLYTPIWVKDCKDPKMREKYLNNCTLNGKTDQRVEKAAGGGYFEGGYGEYEEKVGDSSALELKSYRFLVEKNYGRVFAEYWNMMEDIRIEALGHSHFPHWRWSEAWIEASEDFLMLWDKGVNNFSSSIENYRRIEDLEGEDSFNDHSLSVRNSGLSTRLSVEFGMCTGAGKWNIYYSPLEYSIRSRVLAMKSLSDSFIMAHTLWVVENQVLSHPGIRGLDWKCGSL